MHVCTYVGVYQFWLQLASRGLVWSVGWWWMRCDSYQVMDGTGVGRRLNGTGCS
jgi:ABC-type nickel/cobalt efflux system permease component RcnA